MALPAGASLSSQSLDPLEDSLITKLKEGRAQGKVQDQHGGGGNGMVVPGLPPRQSSDSTLHPAPSGRPSSAPSGRSSFESSSEEPFTPHPGQHSSFEDGGGGGGGGAPALSPRIPVARSAGLPPRSPSQARLQSLDHPPAAGSAAASLQVSGRHQQPSEPSPFGAQSQQPAFPVGPPPQHLHQASELGGLDRRSTHLDVERPRRPRGGKHPANLEHGSTAPAGAIDELAELLLAAAGRLGAETRNSADGSGSTSASWASSGAGSSGGAAAAPVESSGGGGAATAGPPRSSGDSSGSVGNTGYYRSSGPLSAAARGAVPRRSAPLPQSTPRSSAAGGVSEALLSSQVAMLAQQLLLHQHQQHSATGGGSGGAGAGGGTAAAQLRRSMEQAWQVQPGRSRAAAAAEDFFRGGNCGGPATAAEMLLSNAGGSSVGSGLRSSPSAGPVLQSLDPACQPRFSSPTPLESTEATSPFSSIQGVYGCHLVPPAGPEPSPQTSPNLTTRFAFKPYTASQVAAANEPPPVQSASRSSIDLLLDPAVPQSARTHRHSLDTLQELLLPSPLSASANMSQGAAPSAATVAQLLQQLSSSGGGNALPTRRLATVRHSMDSSGGAAAARRETVSRTLSTLPGSRRASRIGGPAASYYGHISSGAMHDIANSTVTVVAGAVPVPAVTSRTTSVSAHASSMVDPAAQPVEGTFEAARVGTPEESMLDPDLHDTFGAHPSYGLPAARARHRHTSSGGSNGSAADGPATANHTTSLGGAAAAGSRRATSVADGWRQPIGASRRPAAPNGSAAGASSAQAAVAAAAGGVPAAAGGSTGPAAQRHGVQQQHHPPTVYHPLQPPLPASSLALSPIGNALMLGPTNVPGQHSITVNDPQYAVPSLHFLKQSSVARKKLERMDSAAASRGAGGGYIAEAKRVLAAAVHTATAQEAAVVESSCSGAIGPLLRYLRDNKHNDAALQSGLHTLSLLVTNSPNRGIIVSFHGQAMLCEAMRATQNVELRENIVQLLWDLEAYNKECHFQPEDVLALQSVLEATSNAVIASHILHLLCHCFSRADAPSMSHEQMQLCARRLVDEIAAHKHHLQDAAQYALGNLLALVLGDARVLPLQRQHHVSRLLDELRKTNTPGQCQVVLTVLSCIAGNARVRSAMAHCHARRCLMDFGQHIPDPRLRARSLSLIKILHKQETLESQGAGSWYFGAGGSETSASPPSASPPR